MILEIGFKIHEITNLQPIGGQEIRTLTNSIQPVGTHKVARDSRDSHGNVVTSGVFFYQLKAGISSGSSKDVFLSDKGKSG